MNPVAFRVPVRFGGKDWFKALDSKPKAQPVERTYTKKEIPGFERLFDSDAFQAALNTVIVHKKSGASKFRGKFTGRDFLTVLAKLIPNRANRYTDYRKAVDFMAPVLGEESGKFNQAMQLFLKDGETKVLDFGGPPTVVGFMPGFGEYVWDRLSTEAQ